jgi:GT2 family glycosyltransferase
MASPTADVPPPPDGAPRPLRLTVAICTFQRPAEARRALGSLTKQTDPPEEVLLIDNDPDATCAWEELGTVAPVTTRVVRERTKGLNVARNRALREASGDVVLFLDDDAVADREWVEAVRNVFLRDPRVGVCTGRVEALRLETEGQRAFEANGGFSRGNVRVTLPQDAKGRLHGRRAPLIAWAVSIGSGNNFAVRRNLAASLGAFDEALDRGRPLPGGGDHDMLWRALSSGWLVVYEPRALAWHDHRRDLDDAYRQITGHQKGLMAMLSKTLVHARGGQQLSLLAFVIWRLMKPGVRVARALVGRDPLPVSVLLRMWANAWIGPFAYVRSKREERRFRTRSQPTVPERS